MAIQGVDTKCYILALFIRDDGERFLLGSGYYEFKDEQMHFSANTIENDTISVQGNDGYLLAGQVRRPGSQEFNGFVGDGTVDKSMVEQKRRDFFSFFRKNFFYKVVYVFPNGTAIQRKRGFLVDDPTVQELYQIYPQYHVALNFEDVNYYSYAEDDDGQEIYAKVAEIQLTASAATGGLIWDASGVVWEDVDYTWSSAPGGTSFVILNQLDMRAKIKDLVIQGDTSQQTYSGKNLYNATMSETTTSSVTYSADNSKMVINGKATSDSGCNFNTMSLKAGTYKFMVELVSGTIASTSTGGLFLFSGTNITTSPSNIALTNTNPKGSITVTVSSDTTNARIQIWARTTDTYTNAVVKYQLVSGSAEDWNFEPFVGGTASPNPDYPQNIDVVTGEQTVKLTGKNICEFAQNTGSDTRSGILFTVNNYSQFTMNGTSSGNQWTELVDPTRFLSGTNTSSTIYIPLDPTKTYTLSTKIISGSFSGTIPNVTAQIRSDSTEKSVSIGSSASFTGCDGIYRMWVRQYADSVANNAVIGVQIEEGSATTYEPYKSQSYTIDLGNTELCKIGTYQDYIYKSGDDWYVHKEIDNITLDGTQSIAIPNWRASATSVGWVYAYNEFNSATIAANSVGAIVSNKLLAASFTSLFDKSLDIGIALYTNTDYGLAVRVKDPTLTTSSAVNTYLGSNPIDVYYPLATPTDTKITDSDLIDDLNGLGALKLFAGNNMLTVTATGSNLPAPVQFKYATAYTSTGAVWEDGGPSGPTTVSVDSIAQVFPVWEVKGPAVNPQLSILTTGTTVTYNGTVTASQVLSIDMFNKTATLNGTSVVGNVSGDWVCFDPGTNRVVYTTGNADALPSTIKWQEIVG